MIRAVSRRLLSSGFLVAKSNGPKWSPLLGNKRQLSDKPAYDMKNIGMENFEYSRVLALSSLKDTKKYDDIKTKLSKLVNNESEVFNLATFGDDLDFFMLVANKDEDIDLVTKSLKFYSAKVRHRDNENFRKLGDRLMKLLFYLKKSDKAIELYSDPKLVPYFRSQTISFYLLNMLYEQRRYEDMVDVFFKYVEYLDPDRVDSKRFDLKKQNQLIPFGEIKMAAIALMLINTRGSFDMFKELLQVCEKHKSVLNNTSLTCWFLLSINQKEYQFAYELLFKYKWNYTLMHNLKAIALLKMNRLGEAYSYLELVTNVPTNPRKLDGKFFKFTVDCFEESLRASKLSQNELKLYENLIEKMKSKLYDRDLVDYCLS